MTAMTGDRDSQLVARRSQHSITNTNVTERKVGLHVDSEDRGNAVEQALFDKPLGSAAIFFGGLEEEPQPQVGTACFLPFAAHCRRGDAADATTAA